MSTPVIACPPPILQFFNNAGEPNSNGSVLTQVGGVNAATYQDSAGNTPLPNPIPLNSRGEISNDAGQSCQLFLQAGVVYTFTWFDANGNQINQATYVSGRPAISPQNFTATGGQTAFTGVTTNASLVFLNGAWQNPATDYSIAGTTLTLVTPASVGDNLAVIYL